MITYNQAFGLMMKAAVTLGSERVCLEAAAGRVLAENIHSDMDMPPFNKSAMDGYACRREDLHNPLTVIEEIPAGKNPAKPVGANQCSKIMTGAPLPEGADCVVMVEYTEEDAGIVRFTGKETSDNYCRKGEDIRDGDLVLKQGELITPAHIAVLATVGCTEPLVARRPRIGVMATGSELVEPSSPVSGAKIRNSNSYQLCAQAKAMNLTVNYYGIVEDRTEAIDAAVKRAKAENDLVLLSGGVSMGDYDLVPEILQNNGFTFIFDSVAMQPGRPTVFGSDGHVYCCGLPGNPVSTFVIFEILLKPFLYGLMGYDYAPTPIKAKLSEAIRRRKTARQSTVPVIFSEPGIVTPIDYHGSAHINAMTKAHGLLTIPIGTSELKQGEEVHVRPL